MYLTSKIFKNPGYQQVFERDGVIKIPFLKEAELHSLAADIQTMLADGHIPADQQYHVTLLSPDKIYKKKVAELLLPLFDRYQKEILNEQRVITANLIVKHAHSGEVPLHQNWTFVDEQKEASLTIWCPLQDVHEENGALYFLKGSHLAFRDICRGPQTPYFFIHYENEVREELEPVYMKAGEALIFDDAILHYSPDNKSAQQRIAIQCNVVPQYAEIYYHEYKKGWLRNSIHKIKITHEQWLQDTNWEKIRNSTEAITLPAVKINRDAFFNRIKSVHA